MKRLLWAMALGLALNPISSASQLAPESTFAGETVSVAQLRVPVAASKELQVSLKRFDAGDLRDSAKHLQKAIRIDDRVPALHHNLGVCYLRLREYEKAVSEFQKASEIDPRMFAARINLTGALFLLGRYVDAEQAAREAYDLDPANPTARYLLSRTLALEGRDTPEVLKMLRASGGQFPAAHLVLANLLLKRNASDDALAELREYMRQPEAPQKDKVACMIERLSQPAHVSTCAVN